MYHGSLRTTDPINLTAPVNKSHYLAQTLNAWWLATPGRFGGLTWYDLVGRNPGTLTTMNNSSNGFVTSPLHPGGYGAMLFDGSAGYVDTGAGAGTGPANLATIGVLSRVFSVWSFWINPTVNTTGTICARSDGNVTNAGWWITFETGPKLRLTCERASVNDQNDITAPTTAVWSHVIIFADTSGASVTNCAMYINGISQTVTHSATGSGASGVDTARNFIIGRWSTASGGGHGFFQGYLNDVRTYAGRSITAGDAYAIYDNSRRGCPGLLNRRRAAYMVAGAAGAATTAFIPEHFTTHPLFPMGV